MPVPENLVALADSGVTVVTVMVWARVPANTSACVPLMFHTFVWPAGDVKFV